ncbi:MAG: hypothetical protein V3V64_10115 [Acidiferrobacterales bacterium]
MECKRGPRWQRRLLRSLLLKGFGVESNIENAFAAVMTPKTVLDFQCAHMPSRIK